MSSNFWTTVSSLRAVRGQAGARIGAPAPPPRAATAATSSQIPAGSVRPPAPTVSYRESADARDRRLAAAARERRPGPSRGGARPGAGRPPKYAADAKPIGIDLSAYASPEDVERDISVLQRARKAMALKADGAVGDAVLAKPGSLGVATVGKINDRTGSSPAELSAATDLIGQEPQTPDPRTVAELKSSRAGTSAAAVSGKAMGLSVAHQGPSGAVPTSQTPQMAMMTAELRQYPDKTQTTEAGFDSTTGSVEGALPTRSLFRTKPKRE